MFIRCFFRFRNCFFKASKNTNPKLRFKLPLIKNEISCTIYNQHKHFINIEANQISLAGNDTVELNLDKNNEEQELKSLTPREVDVLEQFAKGASYKETARTLDISPLTVGNYVKSIYRKLAVNSRGEAVYRAIKSGELDL